MRHLPVGHTEVALSAEFDIIGGGGRNHGSEEEGAWDRRVWSSGAEMEDRLCAFLFQVHRQRTAGRHRGQETYTPAASAYVGDPAAIKRAEAAGRPAALDILREKSLFYAAIRPPAKPNSEAEKLKK